MRVSVLAAGALLLAAPSATAAVTIGSDLAPSAGSTNPCSVGLACTLANVTLPGEQLTSPIDGVVVKWRVEAENSEPGGTEVRLRVIRAVGDQFTGVSSSTARTIPTTGPQSFDFLTRQSIAAGEGIALDVQPPNNDLNVIAAGGSVDGTFARWQPVLGDGETLPPSSSASGEATFNADVEPDADGDGFGDETQDDCPGAIGTRNGCETAPPETTITKGPKRKLKTRKRKQKVRFKFASSEPGSDFRCEVDHGFGEACDSPFKQKFKRGRHSFEVQAIDPAGNADPTPATLDFKLKRKHKRKHGNRH